MTYIWQQPDEPNFRYDLTVVENLLFFLNEGIKQKSDWRMA